MTTLKFLLAALSLGLASCSLQKVTSSAQPTAFLTSSGTNTSEKIRRLPFDHSWKNNSVDLSQYKRVVIRPVTTAYLHKEEWMDSYSVYVPDAPTYVKQCNELARHFSSAMRRSFSTRGSRLALTDSTAGRGTLVIEAALTEVTFGRPEGYVGSMALPGGSLINSAAASPVNAFELKVKDAATGKLVATVADRRGTRLKIVDFNQLTYDKANQEICDEWSQQLMQATNKDLFPQVKRTWFSAF
ncbi:MAG: DUF3313 family protein [Verrucomicrobiales bacterium]